MIVVAQWGNLNRWTYLHQVAVLFSLAERTNHGRVWPEPLLSISTCSSIVALLLVATYKEHYCAQRKENLSNLLHKPLDKVEINEAVNV